MVSMNVVVLAGLLAVTVSGARDVWPFFALAFLQGVGSAIGAPRRALTPSLVPQEILVSALAQRSIAFQLTASSGPRSAGSSSRSSPSSSTPSRSGSRSSPSAASWRCAAAAPPAAEGVVGLDEVLAGVRLIRRTNVLLGAISLDLFAVLLGGAVALLPISRRTSSRSARRVWASCGRRPRSGR